MICKCKIYVKESVSGGLEKMTMVVFSLLFKIKLLNIHNDVLGKIKHKQKDKFSD